MQPKIKQVNSYEFDERFYQRFVDNDIVQYAPSVTYVLGSVYPSHGLDRWRGDVGNKRADEIMDESAHLGSFVHEAIEGLVHGDDLPSDLVRSAFKSRDALKVLRCMKAFQDWVAEHNPKFLKSEYIVWGEGYAGTVDLLVEINGEKHLIDLKTSNAIHDSHRAQIAAYGMVESCEKVAILHLGNRTKAKYSYLTYDGEKRAKYEANWKAALHMFQQLNPNAKPSTETFPEMFQLDKSITLKKPDNK